MDIQKARIWTVAGLAFAYAIFTVVAWTISALTDSTAWFVAGAASMLLAAAFGAWAAIWYSIRYIKKDD